MVAEKFNEAYNKINNFRDKLGEVVYDAINEEGNTSREMAKYIILTFKDCKTEWEFQIADQMLTAICGWNIETLLNRINEKDADEDFEWESCEK